MVSMNDKIGSAFGVTKTNTTNVATFQCPDTGCLGIMQNNKPFFFNINTKRHTTNSEFDISKLNALPRVEINYASLGQDGSLIRSMIKMGVKGIVSAGLGHGNVPDDVMEALKEAKKAGIKVVIASRVPTGMITPVGKFTREGFQSAMLHNPQKARILLMMALTETDNDADIQRMFDQY
jgi:L-asparaginase/Glu-tRNA(Gln) amidotransferase subunit D